jgi:hypothetical protein
VCSSGPNGRTGQPRRSPDGTRSRTAARREAPPRVSARSKGQRLGTCRCAPCLGQNTGHAETSPASRNSERFARVGPPIRIVAGFRRRGAENSAGPL